MLTYFLFGLGCIQVALIAYIPVVLLMAWTRRKGPVP